MGNVGYPPGPDNKGIGVGEKGIEGRGKRKKWDRGRRKMAIGGRGKWKNKRIGVEGNEK